MIVPIGANRLKLSQRQLLVAQGNTVPHGIFQLPDVSGPWVIQKPAHRFRAENRLRTSKLSRVLPQEKVYEGGDIFPTMSQGRYSKADTIQSVIKFLTEPTVAGLFFQVSAAGRDNACPQTGVMRT